MAFQSSSASSDRQKSRSTPAPGARAIAGGVLVTCAMLGVLVAPGGTVTTEEYLVAAVDLAPGEPVEAGALEHQPMHLPPAVARDALTDLDAADGMVARVAVPAGSVAHADHFGDLLDGPTRGPAVTITVPEHRALGGSLTIGDVLDVIATYGSGTEGFSEVIATKVTVTDLLSSDAALGVEPGVIVTIRLSAGANALPVVHAAHADAVSLVADGAAAPDQVFRPGPSAVDSA